MLSHNRMTGRWWTAVLGLSISLALAGQGARWSWAIVPAFQDEGEVSPEAAAEIFQVTPERAPAGSEVTIEIKGRNFARGVYVSFSHPAVHVLTTRRASDEQLEARVAIGSKAPSGALRLYVSNTAGQVAEAHFAIVGGVESTSAPPAARAMGAERVSALTPAKAVGGQSPVEPGTPEVVAVEPPRASPGTEVTLKITGTNFAQGAIVAFSNPGIRVYETRVSRGTELTAAIKVADDAPTGPTGLFVVNPDETETEFPFEVAKETIEASAGTQAAPAASGTSAPEPLRFEVLNLGEGIDIFQNVNKPRGTLTLVGGKVKYEEGGEEVFSAAPENIKEIDVNTVLGVNTGTFHVTLNSGKTFNFVPASLRPAETPSIIEALRGALK
jgi:hypothetical protein